MKCVTAYISVAILFIVQEFSARATYNKCTCRLKQTLLVKVGLMTLWLIETLHQEYTREISICTNGIIMCK